MADKNPTELLNRLIAENPDADDEKLFRLFSMQCGEHGKRSRGNSSLTTNAGWTP